MMPGITKRKYIGETMRIHKKIKRPLYLVAGILPYEYNGVDLLNLFSQLYPFEWREIVERQNNYKDKDGFLKKVGKQTRYHPETPEQFFFNMPVVKNILSKGYKDKHKASYSEDDQDRKYNELKNKRERKIEEKATKIEDYTRRTQEIEPYYIDALIAAYHQKGITTEGKIEIVSEMGKFICEKTLTFFSKINDSERNAQIRQIAFSHLQKSGHYVKLRKSFKGKQKSYMTETFDFNMTPADLANRLGRDTIQSKKQFGVFVSHSYLDGKVVEATIKILNGIGFSCYCDWYSDSDFLKRSLVSEFTKEALKKRMEQSENLLFIRTENSIKSAWVEFELEYYQKLGKPIICLNMLEDGKALPYKCVDVDFENGAMDSGLFAQSKLKK
ncbi:MAG TPA: toll/interleukin-1 receptor domain-containing protein [Bacillota bacterium]|nr:toll/interleukin-1 receptor domain-containing protein [Bacillota bacterium]